MSSKTTLVLVCAWCGRHKTTAGQWCTPDAARGVFVAATGLVLTHGLCPDCAWRTFGLSSAQVDECLSAQPDAPANDSG